MNEDSNFQFLGSELLIEEKIPEQAKFHVIPCPMEKTVSYGSGTRFGPNALIKASNELERNVGDRSICEQGIFTHEAIDCAKDHLECLDDLEKRVSKVISEKKFPVVVGGEHSLTWAAVRGVQKVLNQKIGILQIDAHADLRKEYQGNPHSHASVMRVLAEEGYRIASLGVRAISEEERQVREKFDIFFLDGENLVRNNISSVRLPEDFPDKLYLTLDLDGLDPAIIPAVGTPVPGGIGYYQVLDLIESSLEGRECLAMDIVELAPNNDDLLSPFCAASLLQRILHLL